MRKVFLLITFILIHISVYATESTDSTATTLGEVVVKGKRQYAIDGGVVYIPTRNEKKAARNAQDLLRHIGITQIDVDPQSFSVKTLAGKDVQIFVNGVKSDPESVWTMEVKRVEYLVAPPDPKFLGAQYVINYIVEKYRYGGYTRLSLQEAFLAGLDSRAGIFSRFAYRSMTFDLYASAANSAAAKHRGSSTEETYSLTGDGGAPFLAERRESLSGRKGRADRYPLTFSAMYSGARCSARNSVSFNFAERKDHREDGTVSLWPLLPESGESSRLSDSRGRSVSWYGDAFLWTDNGWHFGYNGSFAYDRNDGSTLYSSPYAGGILTISKEDVFDYRLHLMANKSLGAHRIGLHLSGSNTNNRVVYSGTSPAKNSFSSPALSARFSYGLNISRFNLSFDVAPGWERSKVNSTVNSFFTLVSHLQASFTPDSRNQFSLWAQAAKSGNSPADNSEAVIRLNDLMYVSGNPHLKAPLHFDMNLSYSWIPSDMFTMTAYGSLATVGDRITADFRRHDDGAALLRTLVNSGRFTSAEIGVSLRLTLFGRRLRLSAMPVQRFYRSTGLNAMTCSPFAVKANAYWYQGPFWAGLHYQNGDRSIDSRSGFRTKGRDYYQISAGWGNGNWNVYAGASNIFSRGWKESVSELSGELYTCRRTTYGVSRHASVFVGATYTFGYGKKIDRHNEAKENAGGQSAVYGL